MKHFLLQPVLRVPVAALIALIFTSAPRGILYATWTTQPRVRKQLNLELRRRILSIVLIAMTLTVCYGIYNNSF